MAYLLDSDVFIRASNLHYGFDICPGFWQWLETASKVELVYSIDKVYAELQPSGGNLTSWAQSNRTDFFKDTDSATLDSMGTLREWVRNRQYLPSAIDTFFQVADSYLIAYALAYEHTVVTHEVSAPEAKKVVKIPDVCVGVGVKYMNPFDMLKIENVKFVL